MEKISNHSEYQDGELVNRHFGDRYFSADGGLSESLHVFVAGNRMVESYLAAGNLAVAETGFGTGLNLLAAVSALVATGHCGRLSWTSVELYPVASSVAAGAHAAFGGLAGLREAFLAAYPGESMVDGWNVFGFGWGGVELTVRIWRGDVLEMLASLAAEGPPGGIDCWVLDGHSPALNPGMWSPAVFSGMAAASRLEPPSRYATYTAAGEVKRGLRAAGFTVRRQSGHGRKRHMISGEFGGPGSSGGDSSSLH
jgi:tRNA 5-methylaminomethyl-2-thiouridine biosynthesis bifunctional protein